jgi:alkanesulfonate monooxygenase SsuD/methylene tetrahydromethanopterin reductase-like flavin-dependent oxidoreductase (luciferase family)
MWRGDETPYEGRHYRLNRPLNSPNSLRRPHPPILIGGSGERKTLRLVAQYADACNLFDIPGSRFRDDLPHKLQVLREHCQEVGRDYDEIEKTTATMVPEGEDPRARARALADHLHELAEIGVDHAIVAGHDEALLDAMAGVLPEVHAIPTRAAVLDR